MTRNKVMLLLQSALCIVLVIMLAAAAVGVYRSGVAEQRENPLAWIYTREKAAASLRPLEPVFLLAVAVTAACAVLGVRDENADKPVHDPALTRGLRKTCVESADTARERRKAGVRRLLRLVLLVLAVAFIVLGMIDGGMSAVVNKAIRVCTECVGLG